MTSVSVPVALLAGLMAFVSPCFLPLVPALLAHLAGRGSAAAAQIPSLRRAPVLTRDDLGRAVGGGTAVPLRAPAVGKTARLAPNRVVLNAIAFVLGFSAVFVGLWALVVTGAVALGPHRRTLRLVGGALLVIMGLHAVGLLRIRALDRALGGGLGDVGRSGTGATPVSSLLMGCGFALGWSPCIGPVLGAIIALASQAASAWQGLALMAVFCAGLGAPVIVLALGIERAAARTAWLRAHGRAIRIASGILLIAVGALMTMDLLAPLSGLASTPL
ncbi:cytochrome c biogenesis membrane protein [Actinomyces sp. Chiba101]|uniref:Cytochrome c-type biogenesis protein n=1 Tax=Actinomyces denticolens TaxID=52767 RepID=A0ABY1I6T7_9ACTO|nr:MULTISPECIES: cytochrome c biogenesis protein CcdA [Actinomyces]BAW93388.1 cytochrome c biogenesis membrane protein [Actinomyces sp. Chiba101]GAV93778.1 cytochrome c biogenesis membrane protein [Actinomyces denticolens]SHI70875.1 cytochrome c-type biogenesis protein [Actinomyces denticolens]SUU03305.1 Thiol:disulfide interchange protein [Actinomyces denticolens]